MVERRAVWTVESTDKPRVGSRDMMWAALWGMKRAGHWANPSVLWRADTTESLMVATKAVWTVGSMAAPMEHFQAMTTVVMMDNLLAVLLVVLSVRHSAAWRDWSWGLSWVASRVVMSAMRWAGRKEWCWVVHWVQRWVNCWVEKWARYLVGHWVCRWVAQRVHSWADPKAKKLVALKAR